MNGHSEAAIAATMPDYDDYYDSDAVYECPDCEGEGSVIVGYDDFGAYGLDWGAAKCATCGGTGEVPGSAFLRRRCPVCGSFMFHDGKRWVCPRCG